MKLKLLGKALGFLDCVSMTERPLSLKEAAAKLEISLATASRIGSDLVEAGLLRKSSYHCFEPALGLIHLGQRATLKCVFPKKVNRLIASRCRSTGLKGALAGIYKDRLVYLYNSSHDEAPSRLGLPYVNHPFNSNIALVVLADSKGRKKALKILRKSLREEGDGRPFKQALKSYEERISMLEDEGHALLDGGSFWNACAPLKWKGETLGLALYASPEEARSKERLVFEAKRLRSDIEEALLNSEA